jgi:hypothetical protein
LTAYDEETGGGLLEVNNGRFQDIQVLGDSYFEGELKGATGTFSGNLSAAGGTFSGTLNAATINALTITVSGAHRSGTNYTLAEYNREVYASSQMIGHSVDEDDSEWRPVKTLKVAGTGTCSLVITFKNVTRGSAGQIAAYLYVNGIRDRSVIIASGNSTQTLSDIPLNQKSNIIEFMMTMYSSSCSVTTFQAKCRDDPGLLAYIS